MNPNLLLMNIFERISNIDTADLVGIVKDLMLEQYLYHLLHDDEYQIHLTIVHSKRKVEH